MASVVDGTRRGPVRSVVVRAHTYGDAHPASGTVVEVAAWNVRDGWTTAPDEPATVEPGEDGTWWHVLSPATGEIIAEVDGAPGFATAETARAWAHEYLPDVATYVVPADGYDQGDPFATVEPASLTGEDEHGHPHGGYRVRLYSEDLTPWHDAPWQVADGPGTTWAELVALVRGWCTVPGTRGEIDVPAHDGAAAYTVEIRAEGPSLPTSDEPEPMTTTRPAWADRAAGPNGANVVWSDADGWHDRGEDGEVIRADVPEPEPEHDGPELVELRNGAEVMATREQIAEARGWLLDCGADPDDLAERSTVQVVREVDRQYGEDRAPGAGWAGFVAAGSALWGVPVEDEDVPEDWPVQVIRAGTGRAPATCGTCGRTWDDAVPTSMTPAPGARCPFEAFHEYHEDEDVPGDVCRHCGAVLGGHETEHVGPDGYYTAWGTEEGDDQRCPDAPNGRHETDGEHGAGRGDGDERCTFCGERYDGEDDQEDEDDGWRVPTLDGWCWTLAGLHVAAADAVRAERDTWPTPGAMTSTALEDGAGWRVGTALLLGGGGSVTGLAAALRAEDGARWADVIAEPDDWTPARMAEHRARLAGALTFGDLPDVEPDRLRVDALDAVPVPYSWSDHPYHEPDEYDQEDNGWTFSEAVRCETCGAVIVHGGEDEHAAALVTEDGAPVLDDATGHPVRATGDEQDEHDADENGWTWEPCEHEDESARDLYASGPVMSYYYPCELDDLDDAARELVDTCLVPVRVDGATGLALTGGGMDLSWEIAAAYVTLGYLPPVHFCDLPGMRMAGTPDTLRTVAACLRALEIRDRQTRWTRERLAATLAGLERVGGAR